MADYEKNSGLKMSDYEVYVTLPDDEIVYHGDIPGMLEVFANEVRAHPDGDIQLNLIGDDDPYTLLYYHERKLTNEV